MESQTQGPLDGSSEFDNAVYISKMTTQEAELFEAHPLYRYVKQIATVVLQVRAQLHSNEVKLDHLKTEWDKMRVDLQAFLDKVNGAPEESQSLLENSFILSEDDHSGKQSGVKPFVSVEVDGITRSVIVSSSTEYKLKGTDNPRTRCRLLLEELHSIAELRNWTVSGKRMVKLDDRLVKADGPSVPGLTMQYLYQMEADRRKIDQTNTELMKTLKMEVNNCVGRILESYKSGRTEDGALLKKIEKRPRSMSSSLDLDSDDENSQKKHIRL